MRDLDKKCYMPQQEINSNNNKPSTNKIIICRHNQPADRKMTVKEMQCFHADTVGLHGSRKKKNLIFNSGFPKWVQLNNHYCTHSLEPIINEKNKKNQRKLCSVLGRKTPDEG